MPTHTTAPTISVDLIDDSDRQRTEYGDLTSLAESIQSIGLIHPVVISDTANASGKHTLVVGGRRLATFRALGLTHIPYNFRSLADEADLREAELEENLQRKDMHWSEYVKGIEQIHTLRQARVGFNASKWGMAQTGQLLGLRSASSVSNALIVAKALRENNTTVAAASNLTEAITILLGQKEDELTKLLGSRDTIQRITSPTISGSDSQNLTVDFTSKSIPLNETDGTAPLFTWSDAEFDLTNTVLHGDCIDLMSKMFLAGKRVDHIITDPPYGIEMANLGTFTDIDRVETEHDVKENLDLLPAFFHQAYNILPETGFCVTFCDMQHFEKMMSWAVTAGFKVQRWPLIWAKLHPCINNAAQYNTTKDYEIALLARKGNATLIKPQSTSICHANGAIERKMYRNPFAKPFDVWKWLFEMVAIPGQTALDPFGGEGSMPRAAINCGLRPIVIESSDKHYPGLVENVKEAYRVVTRGKAQFV